MTYDRKYRLHQNRLEKSLNKQLPPKASNKKQNLKESEESDSQCFHITIVKLTMLPHYKMSTFQQSSIKHAKKKNTSNEQSEKEI